MQTQFAFLPRAANQNPPVTQVEIAVTAAVQQLAVPQVETECTMRIVNDGPAAFAWCFGAQAALTLNNGVYMLPTSVETFTLPAGITQLSVIGSATGSNMRVHFGDGA
jgi:hypothetical protein